MARTDLAGRVVVITGGAGGIGRATAEYLLVRGACVTIADIDAERLEAARTSLAAYDGRLLAVKETVATPLGARRIVEETVARFGAVDALVNNAAVVRDDWLVRMTDEAFDEVIDTNLKGAFFCARAAVPHMIARGGGSIVNMVAASGLTGNPGQTNYAAAKGGLVAMTLTWSAELKKYGIAVNAVIPAAWTAMSERIPPHVLVKLVGEEHAAFMRRRRPEQVAPLVAYLISGEARGVSGQCFFIGGNRLSVWRFAQPAFEAEARGESWTEQEIADLVAANPDLLQQPYRSIL